MDKLTAEEILEEKLKSESAWLPPKHGLLAREEEALRKATALRQRKVSTQLKLETMHRNMTGKRRPLSVHDSRDIQFYKEQMLELSDELQRIGLTLARAEKEAYHARRCLLRRSGVDSLIDEGVPIISPLSTSQPITEREATSNSRSLRSKALSFLMTSSLRKRRTLSGELRAVASLSSLPSTTPCVQCEENSQKERKVQKGPLKAFASFMDSRILSRFSGSARRTRSADPVLNESMDAIRLADSCPQTTRFVPITHEAKDTEKYTPLTDAEEEDQSSEEGKQEPMEQGNHRKETEIDPKLLAEIEEFENMAARYIKEHKGGLRPS